VKPSRRYFRGVFSASDDWTSKTSRMWQVKVTCSKMYARRPGEIRTPRLGIRFPRSQEYGPAPGERIKDPIPGHWLRMSYGPPSYSAVSSLFFECARPSALPSANSLRIYSATRKTHKAWCELPKRGAAHNAVTLDCGRDVQNSPNYPATARGQSAVAPESLLSRHNLA